MKWIEHTRNYKRQTRKLVRRKSHLNLRTCFEKICKVSSFNCLKLFIIKIYAKCQFSFTVVFVSIKIATEPNVNVLLALGAIIQTKNNSEGALNVYKNIPNIQDEGFEVWSNIGICFYRKNKLIAVLCFEVTCSLILVNIFILQAISCLKKALWLCPLNFNVLYNLGVVLMTGSLKSVQLEENNQIFRLFSLARLLDDSATICFGVSVLCECRWRPTRERGKFYDVGKSVRMLMSLSQIMSRDIFFLPFSLPLLPERQRKRSNCVPKVHSIE